MGTSRHPAYQGYFFSIVAVGLAVTATACYRAIADDISYQWLVLASLAVLAGSFAVKIPGVNSKISVADTFTFTNIVLFGPAAGTVTAALDGLAGSVRARTASRRLEYTFFNTATMALSAQFAGFAFYALLGGTPMYGTVGVGFRRVVLPMVLLGLIHHLSNSGIVAMMVALETRRNIYRIYRESFFWTSISYFACASVPVLIAANASRITPLFLALLLPVLLIVYVGYKAHEDKTKEQIKHRQLNELYLRTVESLALAVDAKDQTTHSHIHRVRSYAMGLAELCGITSENELMAIRTGAMLHDIGKLAVDDYILNKPARLSGQEFEKMKTHALAGHEIVEQIKFPFPVAKYVRGHHERWDGNGYPDGLKGEDIPLGARILAIADAFDAMRSWRPYKNPLSLEESLQELRRMAGTVFDPKLVERFVRNIQQLEKMAIDESKDMPTLSFRHYGEEFKRALACATPGAHYQPLPVAKTAQLVSLYEFCFGLGKDFDLRDFFLNVAERIKVLMPHDLCVFFLEQGNGTIRADYASGTHSEVVQDFSIEIGKAISGWVVAYQQPIMNTAAAVDFQDLDFDSAPLEDALVVPMINERNCFGTISLYAKDPGSFSEEHLALLQVVAGQTSALVDEARRRAREDGTGIGTILKAVP
jgi:putative nucleotidyltransferase with HDIG domain